MTAPGPKRGPAAQAPDVHVTGSGSHSPSRAGAATVGWAESGRAAGGRDSFRSPPHFGWWRSGPLPAPGGPATALPAALCPLRGPSAAPPRPCWWLRM